MTLQYRINKKHEQKMSSTTCPVFNPTLEEFCNFKKYISHIEHSVDDPGIAKIIPPEGNCESQYIYM